MAVVYVKQLFSGRRGADNIGRRRTYVQVFEVRTDDPNDDAYIAGAGEGIPRNGDPHPSDPFAVMVDITADQSSDDFTLWQVTCEFDSELPGEQGREALNYDSFGNPVENPNSSTGGGTGGGGSGTQITRDDDPRARPAKWSKHWEQTTEIVTKDIHGVAITNSANYPPNPAYTIERHYPVITVQKNVAIDNPILQLEKQELYQEAVNSDDPWGYQEGILQVVRLDDSSDVENGIAFATVTLSFKLKWNGWALSIPDVGFYDLDGERIGKNPKTGEYPSEPVPLDGEGFELAAGEDIVHLEYEVCRPVPFKPLLAYLGITA